MAKIKAARNTTKNAVICKTAAGLFRRKGFRAASMRELAEQLGVEAPSLYNHIGSKSELLQNICFNIADDFTRHIETVEVSLQPAVKKIEQLIRFHIKLMLRSFDEVYVSNHEWKHLEEPYLANFLNQRKAYESKMVQIVKDGINNKEFKKMHPQVTVLTILSAVRGLEFWQKYKEQVNTKALENNIVQHLLNGITK
jgi:AcrR family transcriptional regulator